MKKAKRINARLSAQSARKLTQIIERTGSNMSQVIEKAIEVYFTEAVQREEGGWRALETVGFIGCAEGPRDSSANYKRYLTES